MIALQSAPRGPLSLGEPVRLCRPRYREEVLLGTACKSGDRLLSRRRLDFFAHRLKCKLEDDDSLSLDKVAALPQGERQLLDHWLNRYEPMLDRQRVIEREPLLDQARAERAIARSVHNMRGRSIIHDGNVRPFLLGDQEVGEHRAHVKVTATFD
ncbi:uncharacterized protein PHALS_07004 [Plasmopara halstedii]|uniref:Uncharacterized protein n=1 Tax=Plasmopara halstedii TaxID=4781 RepID=A0A0P1B505_PLAHL|nr:uncharacterized protein PHALS_07004 [Plasmopara halstedii]CEG49232.1 hypothetical protein PHALS_07004 [Plasmopara halstedii]|eukprot:XP_024585601.1 hypothetical protein PHALS_07004 [Plasmopara halstedii]